MGEQSAVRKVTSYHQRLHGGNQADGNPWFQWIAFGGF